MAQEKSKLNPYFHRYCTAQVQKEILEMQAFVTAGLIREMHLTDALRGILNGAGKSKKLRSMAKQALHDWKEML